MPALVNMPHSQELSGATEYGLNGPFVKIVHDRGEKDYRYDASTPSFDRAASTPRPPVSLKALRDELHNAKKDSLENFHVYIPRRDLEEIMSFPQVLKILAELDCFQHLDSTERDSLARKICFGCDSSPPCRKLLAALIGMKEWDFIKCAMDDGMNDDCLPLNRQNREIFLRCQNKEHEHHNFNKAFAVADDRDRLATWTRALAVPYIKQLPNQHFHYVLEAEDHLPMKAKGQVGETSTGEVIVYENPADIFQAHGGFGTVFKVEIHPSHWNFSNGNTSSSAPQNYFALKQLNDKRFEVFETELKSLLFCLHHKFSDELLLEEGQKHMAHVRASFEVRNKTSNKTDYFFLFDWQDGNLAQLWQNEEGLREHKDHPKCMAHQFFGLAAALQCVHNNRLNNKHPDRMQNKNTVYGRHGDLKPSNILYSITKDKGLVLKLADFGLAQLHSRMSRTFGNSASIQRTETYKAPEFDVKNGKISRNTDIFSFGCVILEHITWYLQGHTGVDAFSQSRMEAEALRPEFTTDTYFRVPSRSASIEDAVLKNQVSTHIEELINHPECTWYLCQMLELVRDFMLVLDPAKRADSIYLTKKLSDLCKSCDEDTEFYTLPWQSEANLESKRSLIVPRQDPSPPRPKKRLRPNPGIEG